MAGQVVRVHEAIAEQLRQNLGRNDVNYLAFPDANVVTDAKIEVWPAVGSYIDHWGTYGENGIAHVNVRLRIETRNSDAISAGQMIAELVSCGAGAEWSVWDAMLADRTLGGVAEDCVPVGDVEYDVDDETYSHVAWMPFKVILRKSGAGV